MAKVAKASEVDDFISDFKKSISGLQGVSTSSAPPRYWYHTGNYVLNFVISGSFFKGIPQGRITDLAGPSGAGKSFLASNIMREAQHGAIPEARLGLDPFFPEMRSLEGANLLVVDTENALDDDFVSKIGVDPSQRYSYAGVATIETAVKVISSYLKAYRDRFADDLENAPEIFILLDSLDMMLTDTELENYGKGVQKGDQGQKNKRLKLMLRTLVQDIKTLNVAMVVTSQVYKNQDVMNGEGLWIVADAVRYSCSQILLITKLKLKSKDPGEKIPSVNGIRMKVEGFKTRFTKPFQTVTIEVPYEAGMDPLSGLADVAISLGVIVKKGSRLQIVGDDTSWFEKDMGLYAARILSECEKKAASAYLTAVISDAEEEAVPVKLDRQYVLEDEE